MPLSSESATIAGTFFIYLVLMLLIGWMAYRRTSGLGDFILGGRRLGSWVAALSAGASDMSGWLLLGLPGYAYAAGFESVWLAVGLLAGTYLNWRFLAARLRCYSETADNALTLPHFFAARFADESGLLRGVCAFFILLFFLFYTSAGLAAGGKLFEEVFGLPYVWAVAAGTLAIVLYTSIGGFLAVSWTDLVQALLMFAALVAVPLIAITDLGGVTSALGEIETRNPGLLDPFSDTGGEPLSFIAVLSLLGWGLGYFGQPHILARFKAIVSLERIPAARRIAVTWVAITLCGAILAGVVGIPLLDSPLSGADTEKVFIRLVNSLFHPAVAGICLAAILAAIMSTADSQLMVASAALTDDLYKALLRTDASDRALLGFGRLAVVVIALIAFVFALNPDSKVLDLVAYAWAGFGAAFGAPLILALYWPRMTRTGALAGILGGGFTVVLWKQAEGGWFDLYEIIPGFILSLAAVILVSLFDQPPGRAIEKQFNRVKETVASI